MHNRLLYHPDAVRRLFNRMRADLHEQHLRHLCEMSDLRRELDQVRAAFDELRAASLARAQAHAELASLYRERAIHRAQVVERDPATPLH